LKTADAVAPVAAGAVSTSLILFVLVYLLLLVAFFAYAARLVFEGPHEAVAETVGERPGMGHAGPQLFGGDGR
jgi:cytochrome d ubiquinol oxidase subunit I